MKFIYDPELRSKIIKHTACLLILMIIAMFAASETNRNFMSNNRLVDSCSESLNWNFNSFFGTPDLVSVHDGVLSINSIITGSIRFTGTLLLFPILAILGIYTLVYRKSGDYLISILFAVLYLLLYMLPVIKDENMVLIESAAFLPWFILSLHLYIDKFSLTRMGFFLFNFILTAYSDNIRISIFAMVFSIMAIIWNSVEILRNKKYRICLKKLGFYILSVLVILPNLIITWIKNSLVSKQLEPIHNVYNGVNLVNSLSEKVYSWINLPLNLKHLMSIPESTGISALLLVLLTFYILMNKRKSVKFILYISLLIVVNYVINIKTETQLSTELFLFSTALVIFSLSGWFSDFTNNYIIVRNPIQLLIASGVFLSFFLVNLTSYLFVRGTEVNRIIFKNSIFFYPVCIVMLLGLFAFVHRKISRHLLLAICLVIVFIEFLHVNLNNNADRADSLSKTDTIVMTTGLKDYNSTNGYFFYPGKEFYNDSWADQLKMLNGNTYLISARYRKVTERLVDKSRIDKDPFNWNVINMLNAKYIMFGMKLNLSHLKYMFYDRDNKVILYENSKSLPVVRTVKDIVNCNSADALLDSLVYTDDIVNKAFVVDDSLNKGTYSGDAQFSNIDLTESSVSFEINVKDTAFVVLAKNYFKGLYSLTVDGKDTGYIPVNHCLIGFPVYSGSHKIDFRIIPHDNKVWTFLQNILILLSIIFILFSKVKYLAYCFPEKAKKIKTAVKSMIQKWRSNGKT